MGNSESSTVLRNYVTALTEEECSESSTEFWENFFDMSLTAQDVFTFLQPEDIRLIRNNRHQNLTVLLYKCVELLEHVIQSPSPDDYNQVSISIRILSRVIPILLEHDDDGILKDIFWTVDETTEDGLNEKTEETQTDGTNVKNCLATRLLHCCYELCFLPEFTISSAAYLLHLDSQTKEESPQELDDEHVDVESMPVDRIVVLQPYACLLWNGGIASSPEHSSSHSYDSNRIDVLRLFLACLTETLYITPGEGTLTPSSWLIEAVSPKFPKAPTLFFSLLNTIISFDPVGWGVPYAGSVWWNEYEGLVDISLHVLLALVDFNPELQIRENNELTESEENEQAQPIYVNVFLQCLGSISTTSDFSLLFKMFSKLLNNVHQSKNTYLPGWMQQIGCYQEILILFWKFINFNPAFLSTITRIHNIIEILCPLLFLLYSSRKDPARLDLIHLCTFILLFLSGERNFAVSLNQPYQHILPLDLPTFHGNHGDLLIIVLHRMITQSHSRISVLHNCYLTVVANVSSYLKSICTTSASKLLHLFEVYASPRYLMSSPKSPDMIVLLIDIFNNFIQYQFEGHAQTIYSIVRRKELFEKLHEFDPFLNPPPPPRELGESEENEVKNGESEESEENGVKNDANANANDANDAVNSTNQTEIDASESEGKELDGKEGDELKESKPIAQVEMDEHNFVGSTPTTDAQNSQNQGNAKASAETETFIATQEWFLSWKTQLQLGTILRLLQYLVPQIEYLCTTKGSDEFGILDFLKNTTLVGLLPVPHPIVIRKYQPNAYTNLWFTTYLWGIIFLRHQQEYGGAADASIIGLPMVDSTGIKLFTVSTIDRR